jgi:hypothetical protein
MSPAAAIVTATADHCHLLQLNQHLHAQETAEAGLKWCTLTVDSECAEVLCIDAALFAEVVHPSDLNYSMEAVRSILVKLPRNRTLADIKFLTRCMLRDVVNV